MSIYKDDGMRAARASDPHTSHEAEAVVDKSKYRRMIAGALKAAGPRGMTIDELEMFTGVSRQTLSPRMKEMERLGMAHRKRGTSTKYVCRDGKAGRAMAIWYLGPAPKEVM